jgi:hypothetical protein
MIDKGPWGYLRGGGDPDAELEEDDPAKLADMIGRNHFYTQHVPDCGGTPATAGVCCESMGDKIAAANRRCDGRTTAGYDFGGDRKLFGSGSVYFPKRSNRQ